METKLKEFSKEEIIELLKEIADNLKEKTTIFMIGGGNLSLKKIKAATRDIDLIILTKREYVNLKKILISLSYDCHEETFSANFYKAPIIIFMKDNRRIDVFIRNVSNQLELTKEMQRRSQEYSKFGNLRIRLASNEDVFLFKSITDREKDVDDCYSLISVGLDWEIIKQELRLQEGKALWRFWLYEQLARIKNKYRITTPIENYVWSLVKEKWSSKPSDFMDGIRDERFEKQAKKDIK